MSLSDWTAANPESAGLRSEPLRDLVEWLDDLSVRARTARCGTWGTSLELQQWL
jgi:hypothetical protein